MSQPQSRTALSATFGETELDFLFANDEFVNAVADGTGDYAHMDALRKLGLRLLLTKDFQPPPPGSWDGKRPRG